MKKITEKVFLLESTKGAYVYLIFGKETMLVDTGFPIAGKKILKELESENIDLLDIKHILLTHYDIDHIGNAVMLQKLTGAKLWSSLTDRPYILGQKPRPGFKKYFSSIARIPKPETLFSFGEDGNIDGMKVIPSPGHSPGHVCLLFEDVLFAGDLVEGENGQLLPFRSGWNWDNALHTDSISRVSHYSFEWVCPAHGEPVKSSLLLTK